MRTRKSPAAFRILFGVTMTGVPAGMAHGRVTPAGEFSVEPWRFEGVDNIVGDHFICPRMPVCHSAAGCGPVANGLIITATVVGDSSEFSFSTSQGILLPCVGGSVRERNLQAGRARLRGPGAARVRADPTRGRKKIIPSLAVGANGDVWLAYVQFHHSPDADKLRASPPKMPARFQDVR